MSDIFSMERIIAKRTLREFWEKHSDSEQYYEQALERLEVIFDAE